MPQFHPFSEVWDVILFEYIGGCGSFHIYIYIYYIWITYSVHCCECTSQMHIIRYFWELRFIWYKRICSMLVACVATISILGGWFNIKMLSYQHCISHCGDKAILWPSYLDNGISYAGKPASLYCNKTQFGWYFMSRGCFLDERHVRLHGIQSLKILLPV